MRNNDRPGDSAAPRLASFSVASVEETLHHLRRSGPHSGVATGGIRALRKPLYSLRETSGRKDRVVTVTPQDRERAMKLKEATETASGHNNIVGMAPESARGEGKSVQSQARRRRSECPDLNTPTGTQAALPSAFSLARQEPTP